MRGPALLGMTVDCATALDLFAEYLTTQTNIRVPLLLLLLLLQLQLLLLPLLQLFYGPRDFVQDYTGEPTPER